MGLDSEGMAVANIARHLNCTCRGKHVVQFSESMKKTAISFLVLVTLHILGNTVPAASLKTVNFASNTPTLSGTLPLFVAQEFGFFAAEGLDVRTVLIRGGPTAMAALVAR